MKKIKCNFRTLGKKYGKLMKDIANKVNTLTQEDILEIERSLKEKANYVLGVIGEQEVILEKEDVEIINEDIPGWLVANEGNVTVALEVELTEELLQEGLARELINRIQNMRKDNGLEITDRIDIVVAEHEKMNAAIAHYGEYIKGQVLADNITIAANDGEEVDFDDFKLNIKIQKV